MKKNYFKIRMLTAGLLFSMLSHEVNAQLSGNYTINSANATGGTNFQTFNDLEAALTASGVAGPVTVDVAPGSGPYNEQVLFTSVTGASANNRITINGNGNLLTFNSSNSGQRYTMGFNGADFFTVNDLDMEGTGNYAYTCLLYAGADYNVFSNCSFSVTANMTSSNYIPVVVSGSGSSYSSSSNSGQHNSWIGCDMFSGYIGISFYGPTSPGTYMHGNRVVDCNIRDWYYYGIRSYYHQDVTLEGNLIERPTRTTLSTTYGLYLYQASGSLVKGNIVQKLFEQNQTKTGTCYVMYIYGNSNSSFDGPETHVRNNIIKDIKAHVTLYGYRIYYLKGDFVHNTFSVDHANATSGTTYGAYLYTYGTNNHINAANNLIYINRGGSSSKYGIYFSTTSNVTSDYNNIYFGGAGSNTYAGYFGGAQATLSNLQTATGLDANSVSMDPMFVNATSDVQPTSTSFNNLGTPWGITFDNREQVRNQSTPDIGAIEFLQPTCSGTPSQTVVGPDYEICPGEMATFSIGGLAPDIGLTYQWQMSNLSAVGPFTTVTTADPTNIFYTSPPNNTNMWYSAIVTCTAPGGGSVSAVAQVTVAGTTTNTAPYYEDFEAIGLPDRLPNCSWNAPNQGSSARTYVGAGSNNLLPRSGSSFAAFTNPGGDDYFYTNGIYLHAGITYSASVWYQTDLNGSTNWTDLSILYGTAQSTTGLTSIASTGGPAVSIVYKSLSNTFTVPNDGMYYVAVRATGTSGSAPFLIWDDLAIEIPCSLNSPTISLAANKTSVCAGESVVLTATGADSYSWDNNAGTGSPVTVTPMINTYYTVMGTHDLSGCSSSATEFISVNPSPVISLLSNPPTVCEGQPVTLYAFGADSYNWSTGGNASTEVITPSGPMSYTVTGTNSFGCSTDYVHTVNPNPLPIISVNAPQQICMGESATVMAQGATSYSWMANSTYVTQNPAQVSPQVTTTYTVEGMDENGCRSSETFVIVVDPCVGLSELAGTGVLRVYPNPTNGELTVESNSALNKLIQVTDVSGRVILSENSSDSGVTIDISQFAAGIYYVQVSSEEGTDRIKVVKQ